MHESLAFIQRRIIEEIQLNEGDKMVKMGIIDGPQEFHLFFGGFNTFLGPFNLLKMKSMFILQIQFYL